MGNVAPCLAGGAVVKVMLPDATIEKYDHSVRVAELASKYPNYAVVHCSTAKPTSGQSRAVIVMKMDELLVPGQAYILYPMPKSFDEKKLQPDSLPCPLARAEAKAQMGDGRGSGGQAEEKEEKAVTAEELEKSLSRSLMGPAIRTVSSQVPPLSLETQETNEKNEKEKVDPGLQPCSSPCSWTPDLYQICED